MSRYNVSADADGFFATGLTEPQVKLLLAARDESDELLCEVYFDDKDAFWKTVEALAVNLYPLMHIVSKTCVRLTRLGSHVARRLASDRLRENAEVDALVGEPS